MMPLLCKMDGVPQKDGLWGMGMGLSCTCFPLTQEFLHERGSHYVQKISIPR
ncbi:hypothetical protein CBFG_01691 [Clostridiales bacterium 1_7_47FAA]|nr:hypothetical protein CBFG_01691 [Clostridiales bacterium 1_7_47FAA]